MTIRAEEFLKNQFGVDDEADLSRAVPLSIDSIYHISGPFVLDDDDVLFGDQTEVSAHNRSRFEKRSVTDAVDALREFGLDPDDDEEFHYLDEDDLYGITYAEEISIPEGHIGLVVPSEKLLKAGGTLFTEMYSPETEPPLEGTLRVDNKVLLRQNLDIGSLLIFETEPVTTARTAKIAKRTIQNELRQLQADNAETAEAEADADESDDESAADGVAGVLPDTDEPEPDATDEMDTPAEESNGDDESAASDATEPDGESSESDEL